ncbi:MAG TPA: 5-deoxy-glucuronate isomerase [Terriglobia bacterium]|nr:5-deoxy-glucuronate isomerase [Terriglobia bacterium]
MSTGAAASSDRMIFRQTQSGLGRHISVTPENSPMRHLAYGRIILNASQPSAAFSNGGRETALICLSGQAQVKTGGIEAALGKSDALYIPRDSKVELKTDSSVDIAEFSAEVEKRYPLKLVPSREVSAELGLKFSTGGPGCARTVSMLIAKNVEAGRLLVGITASESGNWTSWPPHEHAAMLEEMYVYFDMPAPAYGIQLVYNNTEYPELVTVVRDGDVVLMPSGYHPNVSVPGQRITFLWALAAHREVTDRQYGVVNVQPEFSDVTLNLQAGKN